jgi:peptidoglycan/LPS O-acetylase OafA/YrhL
LAFLLISGYSIAHSYNRQSAGFYRRRFWRIYPVYLFCLGLCAISFLPDWKTFAAPGGNVDLPPRIEWLNHALFGQGFWSYGMFCFAPSWSLSIEVFFYLLTPLFARCRSWVLIGLILVSAALHFVCQVYNFDPVGGRKYGFAALVVCWAWLAGFIYYRHSSSRKAKSMLFALPAVLSPGPSTVATACGLLFWNRVRLSAWLQACLHFSGEVSYPLYLVHCPVFWLIYRNFHSSAAWVYVVGCLLAACLVHLLIEWPIRWLRHRWGHAY